MGKLIRMPSRYDPIPDIRKALTSNFPGLGYVAAGTAPCGCDMWVKPMIAKKVVLHTCETWLNDDVEPVGRRQGVLEVIG